jgi:hypothetical protein
LSWHNEALNVVKVLFSSVGCSGSVSNKETTYEHHKKLV